MQIKLVGFPTWADFEKQTLVFYSPQTKGKLILDLFTSIKSFSRLGKELRESVLEILVRNKKLRFEAEGYCYNSHTLIPDTISFGDNEELEEFMQSVDKYYQGSVQ